VHKHLEVKEYLVKEKSADIQGDVCSSTLNRSPEPLMSATAVPSVRKPVECGAADIALKGALQLLINRYG